jgi:transmembrane sensor
MTEMDCWRLLENDDFVRWVLFPDEVADQYWETWMLQDPEHASLVEQAREALQQLQALPVNKKYKAALSHEIWEGIQRELYTGRQHPLILPVAGHARRWWAVAASVLILVSAGAGIWYASGRHTPASTGPFEAIMVSPVVGKTLIQCRNQSDIPQRIYLVDGSIVTLEPHSSLSYERLLGQKSREVTLSGNAFFEIAGDAKRPFLVRTGEVVTQVLGTSFRENADPGQQEVQVVVSTGKVSVYKEADFNSGNKPFCILLPHQGAVFHKKDRNLAFEPNAGAQLLNVPAAENVASNFDDAPVTSIFDSLEKMYHIHIRYNRDNLQQCRLTTSLQEEKLTDKLDIICKAINAAYHISGDAIVIDGGHCQ